MSFPFYYMLVNGFRFINMVLVVDASYYESFILFFGHVLLLINSKAHNLI
jgi:hypothetical protein